MRIPVTFNLVLIVEFLFIIICSHEANILAQTHRNQYTNEYCKQNKRYHYPFPPVHNKFLIIFLRVIFFFYILLFILTSADDDFNIARLERYLALAHEGSATPVIVISKADLHDDVQDLVSRARALGALVEPVDARDPQSVAVLRSWCGAGQTVALVGSSGVGKSTLVNTLANTNLATHGVREADSKGRHTTTSRSMHRLGDGGWLLDTPGMRELQLFDVQEALHDVFAEITELAVGCRYNDCMHESEPGCAVRAAIDDGRIDPDRLKRLKKLQSESFRLSASLAERRARDRSQGQLYKTIKRESKDRKRGA